MIICTFKIRKCYIIEISFQGSHAEVLEQQILKLRNDLLKVGLTFQIPMHYTYLEPLKFILKRYRKL